MAQSLMETKSGEIMERHTLPALSESAAILQVIERAAANPNVDIDKMERLLQMQERIVARNAKAAFDAAFADMQPDLPVITERGGIKNNSGVVQSKYALWEDINDAIKPVLTKHGFGISFRTGQSNGKIIVTGLLSHRLGHREETSMELPVDTSGNKNAVQAVGSSTSYGKRYTAQALLNLTSRDGGERDDDGRAAGGAQFITDAQVQQLQDLIVATSSDPIKFNGFLRVAKLSDLPAARFDAALNALNKKAQSNG